MVLDLLPLHLERHEQVIYRKALVTRTGQVALVVDLLALAVFKALEREIGAVARGANRIVVVRGEEGLDVKGRTVARTALQSKPCLAATVGEGREKPFVVALSADGQSANNEKDEERRQEGGHLA